MKKGFTIIEIVISIGIILIVGVSVTLIVVNKKNNNNLEIITEKILEAANLYTKTEKDINGNNYNEMIQKGTKGVAITLEQLVNKGYIEEIEANKIYESNPGLEANQDYYVLFVNGGSGLNDYKEEYCETGQITILPSWVEKSGEPIYLCENKKENTLFAKIVEEYNQNGISGCLPGKEDGLCYFRRKNHTINNIGIYYYTGQTDNNILKIGEELFYIVRTTEEGGVKIAKYDSLDINEEIRITIKNNSFTYTFVVNESRNKSHNQDFYCYNGNSSCDEFLRLGARYYGEIYYSGRHIYSDDHVYSSDWSDSTEQEITWKNEGVTSFVGTATLKSPYYTLVYTPVLRWYEQNIELYEKIIIDNYQWCLDESLSDYTTNDVKSLKQSNFVCQTNRTSYPFGLLNSDEYNAIIKREKKGEDLFMYDKTLPEIGGGDLIGTTGKMTSNLSFKTGFVLSGIYGGIHATKIRPALVLKGDLIVESGTGSSTDPYVIKI